MTQFKFLLVGLCLPVFGFVIGCDNDDDPSNPMTGVRNIVDEPGLQGTFRSQCASFDLDALADVLDGSSDEMLQFQLSRFNKVTTLYTEENCMSPGLEIRYEGGFEIDDDGIPQSPAGTLNVKTERLLLLPRDQMVVDALNAVSFCGANQYSVGNETEITQFDDCPLEEVNKWYYGAYQVQDGTLYLDNPDVFEMADMIEERATMVDMNTPYQKD